MSHVDQPRIEEAVREILLAVGEDPDRDGLSETPGRVARAYRELFSGLAQDDKTMEKTTDISPDKLMRLANRTGGAA